MSKAWVVYESMFGNTRQVADAIASGLAPDMEVDLLEVSHADPKPPADVALIVVGGPTHAFGLSRPTTREDAATKAHRPVESAHGGLREWLDRVDLPSPTTHFATFDTRVAHPHLPGSAAKKAAKRLKRAGGIQDAVPESFWVEGTEGPLLDGEVERAQAWARTLVPAPIHT